MFKDYNRYLKTSLKVYIFVLAIIVILKLVGLDYFGINLQNETIINLGNWLGNNHIGDLILFTEIFVQFYIYLCITCDQKNLFTYAIIGAGINYGSQMILMHYGNMDYIYFIISCVLTIIFPIIIKRKLFIIKQIKYSILITLYQYASLLIRDMGFKYEYGNFLIDNILNLDQMLMLLITYNVHFMKGGINVCGEEQEVGLSLLKRIDFKKSLKRLQRNWHKRNKEEKISLIIYLLLSLIWNVLNVAIILVVATMNRKLVECIFILTSFWLSKRKFGEPFHLSSMAQCFAVSNITYYLLTRVTTPVGISIAIPVMLGVGLSYITSKLVRKVYKPLYRGMPKVLFNETILKVTDKDSEKYRICYEYFIEKCSAISLSMRYHYTEAGIRKIIDRINKKIKEL